MMDFKNYFELLSLYSDYAMVCDSTEWEKWPDFFIDEGTYRFSQGKILNKAYPCACWPLRAKP